MKNANMKLGLALGLAALATATSVWAAEAIEVSALLKCHEGKFDAMNAVSQLTQDISSQPGAVYGWSGIGGYPDGHAEGQSVVVYAPFTVSAPSFVQVGDVTWACVTIQKK